MKAEMKKIKRVLLFLTLCLTIVFSMINVQAAVQTTNVSEGRYWLKNLNGKYLTMTSDKNGGELRLETLNKASTKQVFIQEKDGSNKFYTITAYGSSGKRVVNVYADKSANGKKVVLYKKDTNASSYKTQRWYWVYDATNKAYSIRPADNTKLALTVSGSTVKVATYKANNKNQLWKFVKIPVTGVKLNYSALPMKRGTSYTLKATVSPAYATNKSVTWKSNKSRVTVSSSGKVTVKTTARATDIAKITVTTKDGSKTAFCLITPVSSVPVSGVKLSSKSCTLIPGETKQLKATLEPVTATNKNVTWKSSDTSIVTVNSSGVITAKKDGTATITVVTKDKGKKATCKVTVQGTYALDFSCYNQGYKDWANKVMGTDDPKATIGMWGCLTTCLTGIENYYNKYIFENGITYTPYTLSKKLTYKAGSLQGVGLWTSSYYKKIAVSYEEIYKQLKAGYPVLVMNYYGTTHWLVIYGYKDVKYVNGKLSLSKANFLVADSGGASGLKSSQKSGSTGKTLLSTIYKNYPIKLAKVRTTKEWK